MLNVAIGTLIKTLESLNCTLKYVPMYDKPPNSVLHRTCSEYYLRRETKRKNECRNIV